MWMTLTVKLHCKKKKSIAGLLPEHYPVILINPKTQRNEVQNTN